MLLKLAQFFYFAYVHARVSRQKMNSWSSSAQSVNKAESQFLRISCHFAREITVVNLWQASEIWIDFCRTKY